MRVRKKTDSHRNGTRENHTYHHSVIQDDKLCLSSEEQVFIHSAHKHALYTICKQIRHDLYKTRIPCSAVINALCISLTHARSTSPDIQLSLKRSAP